MPFRIPKCLKTWFIGCCATALLGLAHGASPTSAPLPSPVTDAADPDGTEFQAPSLSAKALFAQTRDAIVQVRVLLASASEQATLGSGFVAQDNGADGALVVTNYHVIAPLAINIDRYRIELRGTHQRLVQAELVAVDVIHDLAVLRTLPDRKSAPIPWRVLPLNTRAVTQGSPVFALGNPLELGFLISEGLYNGSVEQRLYEQMLFSGSLNSGMSGGPTINQQAEVVGVNVATRRDGEQLSFLVPARYAAALLRKASAASAQTSWRAEVGRQLLQHQAHLFSKFERSPQDGAAAGMSTQMLSGRSVPTLDGRLTRCWAQGRTGEKLLYRSDSLNCSLNEDVFAGGGVYAGSLQITHNLVQRDQLAIPQFIDLGDNANASDALAGDRNMAKGQCHGDYVKAEKHVYRITVCTQAYRRYEGLFDYRLTATQVDSTAQRQRSVLNMTGLSFENAQALSRQFLERLQ